MIITLQSCSSASFISGYELQGDLEQIKEDNKKLRKDVKAPQVGQQKHSVDIKKVQEDVASHGTQVEAINSKLDRHEEVIRKIDMGDATEFLYHRTVVAQHLPGMMRVRMWRGRHNC